MLHSKILVITGVEVFFVAFFISYFDINIPVPRLWPDREEGKSRDGLGADGLKKGRTLKKGSKHNLAREGSSEEQFPLDNQPIMLSRSELANYDGSKKSKGLYLSILGKVFDVHKGSKHYGPRGGYHFFAGKDATRAFVSGDFTDSGLTDGVKGLSHQDLMGIEEWLSFYEKQYEFVGYLHGTYYDGRGQPTTALKAAQEALADAHRWKEDQLQEASRFPPCNSEWSQSKGGRVWCTLKSGGITRDWVGVPRKLFRPGSSSSRCACVKSFGPPQDADPKAPHKNTGDLDHPNLQEYTDCNSDAISCALPSDS